MAGLTIGQQPHQQLQLTASLPPTDHALARHALDLYAQCVAAGQWACVNVERLRDGDCISFTSRPWAAATTAARVALPGSGTGRRTRRPNERRRRRKKQWRESRAVSAASAARQRQQGPSCCPKSPPRQAPAPADSQQQQLQPQLNRTAAAARSSYAQAAARAVPPVVSHPGEQASADTATEGAEGPAPGGQTAAAAADDEGIDSRPVTPPLTRACKRKKEASPGETASLPQLDGAEASPPPSPRERPTVPTPPVSCPRSAASAAHPERTGESPSPPPPPPWSRFLPSYWEQVICKICLKGSHGYSRFSSCNACADLR